ncbi:DeoR/GlpR family DNA-binding transcription regulator [Aeromonas veronii]|uniref:DeoR/GlpR family DNA-binding transcription regulator n=1 Tax=Aeromonas veronii TaxID=654 RepID=UPI0032ECD438
MLTSERKALILNVLKRDGRVIAKALSQQFDVSDDTIRRDLRELAGEGLLLRVHGGAMPASSAIVDFGAREQLGSAVKARLGKVGAGLVQPGQIVFIDGGTTNVQLAQQLPHSLNATIVTHSPSIAVALAHHPHIEVELIGGRLFKHSLVAVGALSAAAISEVRADLCFMGATGIHPQLGITTGDREEATIKRLMAEQSAEVIMLAGHEKLGAVSPYRIMALANLGTLITEGTLGAEPRGWLDEAGVTLMEA